jgi:hypothetical protein
MSGQIHHRMARRPGKTSGLEIAEIPEGGANLFHIRDGKVTKLMVYANRDRALGDLGLTPDTGT